MATDQGLAALDKRLSAVHDVLTGDMTKGGHAVGRGGRIEASAIATAVAGDGVLSNMGRKGARLGMRYNVEERGRRVELILKPAGPWVLMERGAKGHTIGKPRRGKPRYLHGAAYGHPVLGPISHPGAPGARKNAITRAFGRMRSRASRDFHAAYVAQLAEVFNG